MKAKLFSKLNNYYEIGKQKLKNKFKKSEPSSTQSTNNSNENNNQNNVNSNSLSVSQPTNLKPKKHKEEDIFKIEEEDGGEINKYVLNYSDEEDEDETPTDKPLKEEKEFISLSNAEKSSDQQHALTVTSISTNDGYDSSQDELYMQEKVDSYKICHYLRPKGSIIDVSNEFVIPCKRIKDKNKIIKMFGFNTQKVEVDYLCYFDEHYYYPIKNNALIEDVNLRRIGNRYSLKLLNNINIKVRLHFTNYINREKIIIT